MTPLTMLPMTQLKIIFLLFYSTKGSSGRLQPAVEQQPLSGLGQHSCCGGEHQGMLVRLMALMLIYLHAHHVRLIPFTGVMFCTAVSFQLAPKTAYSRQRLSWAELRPLQNSHVEVPNPQYLRMGLYLETGPFKRWLS